MDNLDKISFIAMTVLIAFLVVLSMDYKSEAENSVVSGSAKAAYAMGVSDIPAERIKMLKGLVANNNIGKAEAGVDELLKKYPYDGAPHMLMGDIRIRKQDPVAAMYSFKDAIDLNPDYVDKKSELFQGRKIKNTVDEAMGIVEQALTKNDNNKEMKEAKKTVYYLLRKLAGSCG